MEEVAAAGVAAPSLSSPSPRIRPAPVRVVGRICSGGGSAGSFEVEARVSDAAASVSFNPITKEATPAPAGAMTPRKKSEHKLDGCYLKEDSCTRIFDNEVKPLLDAILSGNGRKNACVVTCGAASKTDLVMGSEDPGFLTMAMKQILDSAKPIGAAISISSFQVLQDNHVFDLLEPKDSEVLVREDADGRTHLKGLSRVDIKSIEELENLCCCRNDKLKHPTKASNQLQARGHRGFIIYISRFDQHGRECTVAKMTFLDLAGYVDTKQKNYGGGLAPSNSKKSLYAVMDVVQALNSNQSFIPYRKSKVTHILQDSLCKTSVGLLIACLDEISCQDAVFTLGLASRSSQVVNEQCYSLSLGPKSCSKSNANLSASTKNLSRSLLPAIQQQSSVLQKHGRTQFINSAVKASRTPTANKRSEATMHSAKKPISSVSASINVKRLGAKPILSGRKLFSQSTNSSKVDNIVVVPTMVTKDEEVQPSLHMTIQAPSPTESNMQTCNETEKAVGMQEVAPYSKKEVASSDIQKTDPQFLLVQDCSSLHFPEENSYTDLGMASSDDAGITSDMQEKDHYSSDSFAENSYTDLGMSCLSDAVADEFVENTPVSTTQSSLKLSDQLKEISNSLKFLSTRPVNITKQKTEMVHMQPPNIDVPEPKTPAAHSTGIKKSLAQECLTFLNSANKEQLKSLKCIGEKRANYILELREESPEPLKGIDDLKSLIGMNKKEINMMMSGMVLDSEMDKGGLC